MILGPAQTTSQPVTVNVTNVDEPGVVTIDGCSLRSMWR